MALIKHGLQGLRDEFPRYSRTCRMGQRSHYDRTRYRATARIVGHVQLFLGVWGAMLIRFAGDSRELAAAASRAAAEVSPGAIVVPKTLKAILQETADRMQTIIRLTSDLPAARWHLPQLGFTWSWIS
jgi:hypothetical protein